MLLMVGTELILGLVQSYVLAHADIAPGNIADALSTAFWLWLGFIVPIEVRGQCVLVGACYVVLVYFPSTLSRKMPAHALVQR